MSSSLKKELREEKRCWEAEGINTRPTNGERAWAGMTRKPGYLELYLWGFCQGQTISYKAKKPISLWVQIGNIQHTQRVKALDFAFLQKVQEEIVIKE